MKKPTLFQLFLLILVVFFLATRLYILQGNNFHFTVDQGRDAIFVRDIIKNHTLFLKGPETSIRGVFTGPLWYYFLVPGYLLTNGHPVAAPLSLTFLNLIVLIYLTLWLKKNISLKSSLLVSVSLLFFWPFFETSLYGFNPFPTVALAILQITFLVNFFTTQKRKFYLLSLIALILSFNTHLAIAIVFLIFQIIATIIKPKSFVHLALLLALISLLFFSFSPIYRPWYTVYLSPVLYISLLLVLSKSKSKLARFLLISILLFQFQHFCSRYLTYLKPASDPSLLYNQLTTIDQIYESATKQGFAAYNYTDTFFDYPYQYLFYWYGLKKYDYLPCEYANYPLSPKETYIPNYSSYLEPRRSCDRYKFLIIQSNSNGEDNSDWINTFRAHHTFVNQIQIGNIILEKYEVTPTTPSEFCLWWHDCQ